MRSRLGVVSGWADLSRAACRSSCSFVAPPNGFVVILSHLFPSHFGNVVKQVVIVTEPALLWAAWSDALVTAASLFIRDADIERNAGCFDGWNLDKWHWPLPWRPNTELANSGNS